MSMIDMFLKSIGFDAAEFMLACEYYKQEFDGMKTGLQHAVSHFNGQLTAIEASQALLDKKMPCLLRMQAIQIATPIVEKAMANGHDINDNQRSDINSDIN